jgi:hypothetical protein
MSANALSKGDFSSESSEVNISGSCLEGVTTNTSCREQCKVLKRLLSFMACLVGVSYKRRAGVLVYGRSGSFFYIESKRFEYEINDILKLATLLNSSVNTEIYIRRLIYRNFKCKILS